jgi:hypothetical protein
VIRSKRVEFGLCDFCAKTDVPIFYEAQFEATLCSLCNLHILSGDYMSRNFWTTQDGRQVKISEMDLGHLANTIRMLGPKLEEARKSGSKRLVEQLESDLIALQTEHDSRDKEIEQMGGIFRALTKGMTLIVIALACACEPGPAWVPGDPPLTFWCPDDETCLWFKQGSRLWEPAGLTVKQVDDRWRASIEVFIDQYPIGPEVVARPHLGCSEDPIAWDYRIFIHPEIENLFYESDPHLVDLARAHVGHQIGHVLGIWDHLPAGSGTLMESHLGSLYPTSHDFAALPFDVEK